MEAVEAMRLLTSPDSGQLRMLAEDPDVTWEIDYRVDHAAADYEKFVKDKEAEPGVTFFLTNPTKPQDEPFWTIEDWMKNTEGGTQRMDRDAPEGARPPTPEELAEMQERRRKALEGADD